MIIEFFGMPGSGKTTIVNQWIGSLKESGINVSRGNFDHLSSRKRILKKIYYSFLFMFKDPIFYFYNLNHCLKVHRFKMSFFNDFINVTYLLSLYEKYKRSTSLIVFDQGILQSYWSLKNFSIVEKEYNNEKLFSYIDKVIILEIDKEENQYRLKNREDKRSRMQKSSSNNFDSFINSHNDIIKSYTSLRGSSNIIKLNAQDKIDNNVDILNNNFK